MKLHKLTNTSGEVFALEIGSFPLGRGAVAYFIAKMKDVKISKGPVHGALFKYLQDEIAS